MSKIMIFTIGKEKYAEILKKEFLEINKVWRSAPFGSIVSGEVYEKREKLYREMKDILTEDEFRKLWNESYKGNKL